VVKSARSIEEALQWAYRDGEYREPQDAGGVAYGQHPMWSLSPRTHQNWHGGGAVMTAPHPDAMVIVGAIGELRASEIERLALCVCEGFLNDVSGMIGLREDAFLRSACHLVPIVVQTCAKLRKRPDLPDQPRPRPLLLLNQRPAVMAPSTIYYNTIGGEKLHVKSDTYVKQTKARIYPDGAYCPLIWELPDFNSFALDRAEYCIWAICLNWLADRLSGRLQSMEIADDRVELFPWEA